MGTECYQPASRISYRSAQCLTLFCPITLLFSAAQHARAVVASHQTGNAECASVSVIADHVKQSCYHASAGPITSGIIATHGPAVISHTLAGTKFIAASPSCCCACHTVHLSRMQSHMQAVPSGSGRLSLGALQEQQQSFAVSHATHPSGKALITAALSEMGFAMRSGKVGQQHKVMCVSQMGLARMHPENVNH